MLSHSSVSTSLHRVSLVDPIPVMSSCLLQLHYTNYLLSRLESSAAVGVAGQPCLERCLNVALLSTAMVRTCNPLCVCVCLLLLWCYCLVCGVIVCVCFTSFAVTPQSTKGVHTDLKPINYGFHWCIYNTYFMQYVFVLPFYLLIQ